MQMQHAITKHIALMISVWFDWSSNISILFSSITYAMRRILTPISYPDPFLLFCSLFICVFQAAWIMMKIMIIGKMQPNSTPIKSTRTVIQQITTHGRYTVACSDLALNTVQFGWRVNCSTLPAMLRTTILHIKPVAGLKSGMIWTLRKSAQVRTRKIWAEKSCSTTLHRYHSLLARSGTTTVESKPFFQTTSNK